MPISTINNEPIVTDGFSDDLAAKVLVGHGSPEADGLTDADDAAAGTTYFIYTPANVANLPVVKRGMLITFTDGMPLTGTVIHTRVQLFVEIMVTTNAGWHTKLWYRSKGNYSRYQWSVWENAADNMTDGAVTTAKLADGSVTKAKLASDVTDFALRYVGQRAAMPSTDMDYFPVQGYWYVSTSWFDNTGGLPYSGVGYLLVIGREPMGEGASFGWRKQFFMTNAGAVYTRYNTAPTAAEPSFSPWADIAGETTAQGAQWKNRKWYAYGTSMTEYTNKPLSTGQIGKGYAAFLPALSGLSLGENNRNNRGKGGSGIVPSLHDSDNVKTRCMTLDDGKAEADLITLEIGPNDGSAPIGELTDVYEVDGHDTFLGHLADILRYLQENTTAQIVVLTTPLTRYVVGHPEQTRIPEDYIYYQERIELMKRKCALYHVPVLDGFSEAGLGIYRVGYDDYTYVGDQIHLTAAGGYNLAKFYWEKLKSIPRWYTQASED